MTIVRFMCGHQHDAPSPTDEFVKENMMDSHGMLICPDCKHLPAQARRRFGYQSLPTVPGQDGRALYTFAGLSLRDMERWVVWGFAPPKVKLDIDPDVPDRRELREPAEILAAYRRERDNRRVESG